jgi:hypothetical protein
MRTFSLVTQHGHGGSLAENRHTSTSQPINTKATQQQRSMMMMLMMQHNGGN